MKPIIGIFPSYNEEKKQIFLNQSYFDAIIKSGGIPVALPLLQDEKIILETIKRFDGIILSGGSDINPKYYNQINSGKSLEINSFRDESEEKIVRVLIESDIPVLGICRGMQAINVFCGGSMIQDIPSEYETEISHSLTKPEIAFHKISVEKSSPLSDIIGFGALQPNLGVVDMEEGFGFVIADIPGLIEGASEGIGLGHEFLRHIERTKVMIHIVDAAGTEGRELHF